MLFGKVFNLISVVMFLVNLEEIIRFDFFEKL